MTGKRGLTQEYAARILGNESPQHAAERLRPDLQALPHVPAGSAQISRERARALWDEIGGDPALREILLERAPDELRLYQGNIENAIGVLRMPIGLAGPLRVNGIRGQGRLSDSAGHHRGGFGGELSPRLPLAYRAGRVLGAGAFRKCEPRAGIRF